MITANPQEGRPTRPPRVLGSLLVLLGLVLLLGGVSMRGADGSLYFIVLGTLIASSGTLLALGRAAAIPVYAATLAVCWVWSLVDLGGDVGQLISQVFVPTLIGLYLFSSRVRSRLR